MAAAGGGMVILTGAGISRESGLSTFRDRDGIWSRVRIEDVATPEAFARDPDGVLAFYRSRLAAHGEVRPNAAHLALARLEREWAGPFLLVTQNIDNLHELAGSRRVLHMHGEIRASRCGDCGARWRQAPFWPDGGRCPRCAGGRLRPDVVWFGETPYGMDAIEAAVATAAVFVSCGTSGTVYPAAGLAGLARAGGAECVELNLEASDTRVTFDEVRRGPATVVVPEWVASRLAPAAGEAGVRP